MEEVLSPVRRAPAAQGDEVTVAGVVTLARRSAAYMRDVRAEIRKVTWPSWLDLRRTTVVVSIFVIVIGIIIGILDRISSLLLIEWFPRLFS
jgi:preprotein translocase subunit SecE